MVEPGSHSIRFFTLHVRFAEGGIGRFPVVLLVNRIGDVGVEIEALIALFPHFLAQFQFRIGFTFVTETVFTLGTRCLETLLFAAASRPANTGTGRNRGNRQPLPERTLRPLRQQPPVGVCAE
ncbi:Uncharacterised protein [Salmonella enterica subsp. enterica]|uniref:Uncharacterized protein n=1 Tax=Salmonella enterica I TaxID=59201 RepID=A0A3S4HPF7_SALET|nr:Uncharacterised protein [Salmonella enterica subsp. enterica]